MGLLLILCTLTYIFLICNADDLQLQELSVVDGQGFVAFLKTRPDFGTIQVCKVLFGKDEYEIDMTAGSSQEIKTKRGEVISPYSATQCGFRILKVKLPLSQGKWHVKVFNENKKQVSKIFNLTVLTKPEPSKVTNIERKIGFGTLTCSNLGTKRSCRISNDKDLSYDKCEANAIFREPSTWYCRTMNWGTMEESKETINVGIEKKILPNITVEETDVEFKLGCSLPYSKIPGCRAEYPDGTSQLFIGDNLHHNRYSTAGTDLERGYCALSIKKPIAYKEKGIWRIYQLDTSPNPSALKGCLLYVGDKKNLIQKTLDAEADDVKNIEVIKSSDTDDKELADDTFALTCNVPFTVDRCYLRDPSGKVHFQNEFDFKYSKTLGMCTFRNLPKLHGSWICGLYGKDYEKEIIRKIDIKVVPKEGEVLTEKITALFGDSVDLLCRTAMAQPITECAFTDPQGKVYLLSNNFQEFENSRISYFGQGLQNGQCGLKIRDINKSEFGKWSCQFSGPQIKSLLYLQLEEPPTNIGTIIGASAGLAVIVCIVFIGVFIFIRRRKRSRTESQISSEEANVRSPESTSL